MTDTPAAPKAKDGPTWSYILTTSESPFRPSPVAALRQHTLTQAEITAILPPEEDEDPIMLYHPILPVFHTDDRTDRESQWDRWSHPNAHVYWPSAAYVGISNDLERRLGQHGKPHPEGTGILNELVHMSTDRASRPFSVTLRAWLYPTRADAARNERLMYWHLRTVVDHAQTRPLPDDTPDGHLDDARHPLWIANRIPPLDGSLVFDKRRIRDLDAHEYEPTRTPYPSHFQGFMLEIQVNLDPRTGQATWEVADDEKGITRGRATWKLDADPEWTF